MMQCLKQFQKPRSSIPSETDQHTPTHTDTVPVSLYLELIVNSGRGNYALQDCRLEPCCLIECWQN